MWKSRSVPDITLGKRSDKGNSAARASATVFAFAMIPILLDFACEIGTFDALSCYGPQATDECYMYLQTCKLNTFQMRHCILI